MFAQANVQHAALKDLNKLQAGHASFSNTRIAFALDGMQAQADRPSQGTRERQIDAIIVCLFLRNGILII
jgi:hypothetical protein